MVEFRDASTNKMVRLRTIISTNQSTLPIGSQVTVRHISGNEYLAEIDGPLQPIWGFPVVAWTIGALFFGLWWLVQQGYWGIP